MPGGADGAGDGHKKSVYTKYEKRRKSGAEVQTRSRTTTGENQVNIEMEPGSAHVDTGIRNTEVVDSDAISLNLAGQKDADGGGHKSCV
jgi:hypothetical protein